MCWRLRYETIHQEQWSRHTLSSAEKSCRQDRVLRFSSSRKGHWERGNRITQLKPQLLDIRFEANHEGDKANVNITGYDVDNLTISRSTNKYLYTCAQNIKHKNRFGWPSACEFVCEWFSTCHIPLCWVRVMVVVVARVVIRVWMIAGSNYNSNPGYRMRLRAHWRWESWRVLVAFWYIC